MNIKRIFIILISSFALFFEFPVSIGPFEYNTALPMPDKTAGFSKLTRNKVQLFVDQAEIVPLLFNEVRKARKSIQMDLYLLGGEIGLKLARELVAKSKQGVDVKVIIDPTLGFAGPVHKEVMQVLAFLKENRVNFKFYPLALMPVKSPGFLKNKAQMNHNKIFVFDNYTFLTGGFNLLDIGLNNRDLIVKIEGPTALEASEMLDREWNMAQTGMLPPVNENVTLQNKEEFSRETGISGNSLVKIIKNAPRENTIKSAILEMIEKARRNVYVAVYDFSDRDIEKALIKAYRRGIDVKVLLEPKDKMKKYGAYIPANLPNIMVAKALFDEGIPVKWFASADSKRELHMKTIVSDGKQLITGSSNFTTQSFTTFVETGVYIEGGPAPLKMEKIFSGDWQNHSREIKGFSLWDNTKIKIVEYMDDNFYAWW
jgi:phosphatidylserine/phosphatidylglycerophosphate/cardiolipin synthase-like enzyme